MRRSWILVTLGALALSCQAVNRTYSSSGPGGAASSTSSTGGAASSSSSSSQGSGATGGTGGAGGAPVSCDGGLMACGEQCVDIGTSSANCGACGHDCGGGMCALGQCQPALVYTATVPIGTLTVSTTEVYFATVDDNNEVYKLLACPTSGCTLAPRQVVSMEYSIDSVVWVNDPTTPTVVFISAPAQTTERPAVFPCPASGCPGAPTSVVSDGLNGYVAPLAAVGQEVYWDSGGFGLGALTCTAGTCTTNGEQGVKDTNAFAPTASVEYYIDQYIANTTHDGYILSCPLPIAGACTPTTVLAQDVSGAVGFAAQGGALYWMIPGQQGTMTGYIQTCAVPGCSTQSYYVKGLSDPSDLVVDADGAYWVTSTPSIQRCIGAQCAGGAQDLVTSVTAPHDIATDASFVYWADGNSVYRIAK